MRVADIEIDKDHTLTLFCEASQTAKVDAMFVEVERLRAVTVQALEAMEKATRYMSNSDYIKLNQTIDATRAALKETK